MAAAAEARIKPGQEYYYPYYVGTSVHKPLTGGTVRHTHYVLIRKKVAARMGMRVAVFVKGSDTNRDGVVFNRERKAGTNAIDKTKKVLSKRYIERGGGKVITAYCDKMVRNKAGKLVQESYSIGFPSGVSMDMIRAFFIKNTKNVVKIKAKGSFYAVVNNGK
jgi:hypothetical protein